MIIADEIETKRIEYQTFCDNHDCKCFLLKGSYGRLGMGDSLNQPRLKRTLIPSGKIVCQVSSSVGSDGHTLALTTDGEVYSWGDGKYIKCKNFG